MDRSFRREQIHMTDFAEEQNQALSQLIPGVQLEEEHCKRIPASLDSCPELNATT